MRKRLQPWLFRAHAVFSGKCRKLLGLKLLREALMSSSRSPSMMASIL
jgi:hypothetical protein